MGANFAPSYTNLTMGYWELQYISHNNPFAAHIIYYGRYIDDIILIWEGTSESIESFVKHCNCNSLGLSFTHVIDPEKLIFLDLELFHSESEIHATNFVKPTAGNSYIHYQSCHHPTWINNIPKSQFHRIRRNCTKDEDYHIQGKLLSNKFQDKGYPPHLVQKAFLQQAKKPPPKPKTSDNPQPTRFTTQFHDCHKKMENILAKHWCILLGDPFLGSSLTQLPKVSYRRAKNIKSRIAPSKIRKVPLTPASHIPLIPLVGMYQCRKKLCLTCKFVDHGQKNFTVNFFCPK